MTQSSKLRLIPQSRARFAAFADAHPSADASANENSTAAWNAEVARGAVPDARFLAKRKAERVYGATACLLNGRQKAPVAR
jgi:hypothetical protein